MKICCLTLGLLMLLAVCQAMPRALRFPMAPGNCCFSFYEGKFPPKLIANITKTHSLCPEKGFIIWTVKGRQICYGLTPWAKNMYNQLHGDTGSGDQH